MRIRNLTADSMPEAMALVRAQLGVDAVILSTDSNGVDGKVRVTAALEDDDPNDQELQFAGARTNAIDSLTGTLSFHRLPDTLSNRMLRIAARLDLSDAAIALGGALDAELRFAKLTDLTHDRPIMLVGPPGAGKTSTAAKLCTLARLADCGTRMITLDSVKAGGLAQITTYGDALGAQVAAARDPDELMEKLRDQPENTLTLIDTVGANPFDRQELAMLRQVADRAQAITVLVLPAGGDVVESAEVAMAFSEVRHARGDLDQARHFEAVGRPSGRTPCQRTAVDGNRPLAPDRRRPDSDQSDFTRPADVRVQRRHSARPHACRRDAMRDQLAVRDTRAATPGANRMTAIASGKGGVGKTWLSITLAHALSLTGRRVLLFDGDLGLANVDIQLGLQPEADLGGVIAGRYPLAESTCRYQAGGFDVIAGRSGSGSLANLAPERLSAMTEELDQLARGYDHVILDLGAGIERTVRYLGDHAETCLVVATDEPTALTDAYAFIKLGLKQAADADLRIVVNMASNPAEGQRTYATLRKACQSFLKASPALAGIIPRDSHVKDAIRSQSPLFTRHPGAPAAVAVEALAQDLLKPGA